MAAVVNCPVCMSLRGFFPFCIKCGYNFDTRIRKHKPEPPPKPTRSNVKIEELPSASTLQTATRPILQPRLSSDASSSHQESGKGKKSCPSCGDYVGARTKICGNCQWNFSEEVPPEAELIENDHPFHFELLVGGIIEWDKSSAKENSILSKIETWKSTDGQYRVSRIYSKHERQKFAACYLQKINGRDRWESCDHERDVGNYPRFYRFLQQALMACESHLQRIMDAAITAPPVVQEQPIVEEETTVVS